MKLTVWAPLGAASQLLLSKVFVDAQAIVVASCAQLKNEVEAAAAGDTAEQLVLELGGADPIVCRDNIYIPPSQAVRIEGAGRTGKTKVLLDAKAIYEGDGRDNVGNLFTTWGDLELHNLEFNFDPEANSTTKMGAYGTRIVQNYGNAVVTDCSFVGSQSAADQKYVLGQAVKSDETENTTPSCSIKGLTYDNRSPSQSVIRASGGPMSVEDSSFVMGSDAVTSQNFGTRAFVIYCGHKVELTVSRCRFSSGGNVAGGMAIQSAGGLIEDCTFVGQNATFEGSGAVYCPLDSTDRPMIIESSLFEGNTAGVSASAVACHDRDLIIRDTQFIDNKGTPILFESSNARGDHQFDMENCKFEGNIETKDGTTSKYGGGAAVVVRNLAAMDESVATGSFTDLVCDSNSPVGCEILQDMAQIDHIGNSTCRWCGGGAGGSGVVGSGSSSSGSGSGSGSGSRSTGGSSGDGSGSSSSSGSGSGSSTGVGGSTSSSSSTNIPCGSSIAICKDLKTAVEGAKEVQGVCQFFLSRDVSCAEVINVGEGQEIVISGKRNGIANAVISAATNFTTQSAVEDAKGVSMFVVSEGGQLTLDSLGYKATITPVRGVHSYGDLYVDSCEFSGSPSDAEYGGAIYSEVEIGMVLVTSSTFSNFTAIRGGGAIYATGAGTNVTINRGTFSGNGVKSDQPGRGGALAVTDGVKVYIKDSQFSDNYGYRGGAVYCNGGTITGSSFVGGDSQSATHNNGGVRSVGHGLVVNGCSFINTSAVAYDGADPGSALQVFSSDLKLTDSTFEGNKGTPLYVESSARGESYSIEMDGTSFHGNTEAWADANSDLTSQGVAAMLNAKDGGELVNTGGALLTTTCMNNVPSRCEIIVARAPLLFADDDDTCNVCDESGISIVGSDITDDTFITSSSEAANGPAVAVDTCEEVKIAVESGQSGTLELTADIICDETIKVVDGQSVSLKSGGTTPGAQYSVKAGSPFTGGASASTSAAPDGSDGGDNSIFMVEKGGALDVNSVKFDTSGGSGGGVRAIYNAGNLMVDNCEFVGAGAASAAGEQVTNGGAIYMASDPDAPDAPGGSVTCTNSSFSDHGVSGGGGAIYAEGGGDLNLKGTEFSGNSAGEGDGRGGAVFSDQGVNNYFSDSSFDGNSAHDGGAIACYGGTMSGLNVTNSVTSEKGYGAVVCNEPGGSPTAGMDVTDSTFVGNKGGGLAAFNSDLTIGGTNFAENTGGAAYFETSDIQRRFDVEVDGVTFENNSDPATAWGAAPAEGDGGSDLVMRSTGDGQITSTAKLNSVGCIADVPSKCGMAIDDTKFTVTGDSLDCGVCNLAGEPIEVASANAGIPASSCGELKTAVESGQSGTVELTANIICDETIKVVDGQSVSLTSGGTTPGGQYSVKAGSPFTGGASASTSTEEDRNAGDDHSIFVVEKGGTLDANSIVFDTKTPGTPDEGGSVNDTSSASNTTTGGGGVRAIYNAGNLTIADCEFTGSGTEASQKVKNGGAIYMAGDLDAPDASFGSVTCTDSYFSDNGVGENGGAIFAEGGGDLNLKGNTFERNEASDGRGGAVFSDRGVKNDFTDNTFDANAAMDGAAIVCYGGTMSGLNVTNSVTSEEGYGAVISNEPGGDAADNLTIADSSFVGNDGGALAAFNSDLDVVDTDFSDNIGTATYFETSDKKRGFDLELNGVNYQNNSDPAIAWGVDAAEGPVADQGSDLVMRDAGDGEVPSTAHLNDVSCAAPERSRCGMSIDDANFNVSGSSVECGVCNLAGEALDVEPGVLTTQQAASTCGELKSQIEEGTSGTFEVMNDITCDETITIVEGQSVSLRSGNTALVAPFGIMAGGPFIGSSSAGDSSIFVVEKGGDLDVSAITFDTSSSSKTAGGDASNSTSSSAESSASGGGGVRAIFNAGKLTTNRCDFVGPGVGSEQVKNGGAIYMAGDLDTFSASFFCTDSSFSDHGVSGSGGAIYAEGAGKIDVQRSTFDRNSAGEADGRGGAIYSDRGVVNDLSDNSFDANSAHDGGAIACYGGTMRGLNVTNSVTSEEGHGAVVSNEPGGEPSEVTLTIADSSFIGNKGGGLAAFNSDLGISDTEFKSNTGTATYVETSLKDRGFDIEMEGVNYEDNSEPMPEGGTEGADDTRGSDLVMRSTGSGVATGTADFKSVTCAAQSECGMAIDDSKFDVTGESLDCDVCDLDGEVLDVQSGDADSERDADSGDWGWKKILAVALPCALILLLCCGIICCCCFCRKKMEHGHKEPVAPEPGHHDDSNIAFYATSAAGAGLVYGHSAGLVNGYPAGLARGYPSRKKRDTFDTAEAGHASAPTASSFGSTTAMGNSGTGVPPGPAKSATYSTSYAQGSALPPASGVSTTRSSAPPAGAAGTVAAAGSAGVLYEGSKPKYDADYTASGGDMEVNEDDYNNAQGTVNASSSWMPQTISGAPEVEAADEVEEPKDLMTTAGPGGIAVGGTRTTMPSHSTRPTSTIPYSKRDTTYRCGSGGRHGWMPGQTAGVVAGGSAAAVAGVVAANTQSPNRSTTSGSTFNDARGARSSSLPSAGTPRSGHVFSDDEDDGYDEEYDEDGMDSAGASGCNMEYNRSISARAERPFTSGVTGIKSALPGDEVATSSAAPSTTRTDLHEVLGRKTPDYGISSGQPPIGGVGSSGGTGNDRTAPTTSAGSYSYGGLRSNSSTKGSRLATTAPGLVAPWRPSTPSSGLGATASWTDEAVPSSGMVSSLYAFDGSGSTTRDELAPVDTSVGGVNPNAQKSISGRNLIDSYAGSSGRGKNTVDLEETGDAPSPWYSVSRGYGTSYDADYTANPETRGAESEGSSENNSTFSTPLSSATRANTGRSSNTWAER